MKRSQLVEIIREIVGGYEPDGKGNLVRHNDKFDSAKLSDILKGIVDRDSQEEQEGEDPIYEGENRINVWSKHPYIKDLLNAMINKDGTVYLQIYGTKGGLPIKQTAVIPIEDFTPEYVEKQVSDKYTIDTEFRKGIQQFVDSVQNTNA